MAFLTFNSLNTRTFSNSRALNESLGANQYSDKMVFLSYRREDKQLVDNIVRFLKRIGVAVYIDYLDETLEDRASESVAQTLRDRINKCKKFICLATPNSGKSKWMPWELGLGDRIINYPNVAVLPVTDNPNTWHDQEYGKIYGRVENISSVGFSTDDNWFVIFPNNTRIGLKAWLLN